MHSPAASLCIALTCSATEVCDLDQAGGLVTREREVTAHGLDEPQTVFVVAHVLGDDGVSGWLGGRVVSTRARAGGWMDAVGVVAVLHVEYGPTLQAPPCKPHLESGDRVLELVVIADRVRTCWY